MERFGFHSLRLLDIANDWIMKYYTTYYTNYTPTYKGLCRVVESTPFLGVRYKEMCRDMKGYLRVR